MNTPENAQMELVEFLNKKKFKSEGSYPGIADKNLLHTFTENINQIAIEFQKISQSQNPTPEQYQTAVKKGLNQFSEIYLEIDTEDRERICTYIEELMDIIELESSNGLLNKFLYGIDPNEIIKEN